MTGCNRVFALFPYLFECVPMFWCSGFDCLNIMPVPFSLQISNGRSDPWTMGNYVLSSIILSECACRLVF